MKIVLFPFIVVSLIISACSSLNDGGVRVEEKMYTLEAELPSNARFGESMVFTLRSGLPSSCWEFSRIKVVSSSLDVFVTALMKKDPEEIICLDVVTPISEDGVFVPHLQGEYRFHFWRSDSTSLDYTVSVQ